MSKQTEFIDRIAPIIQKYAKKYGFNCPSGVIAQACLESAWGVSDKAAHNNFFGLKYRAGRVNCHSGYFKAGSSEEYKKGQITRIVGTWYAFDSMEKGVEGYFQFITNGPYPASIKEAKQPRTYLQLLKNSGYATSSNYVENNMRVVEQYGLIKYDEGEEVVDMPTTKYVFNVHGGHNRKCPGAHGYFDETTEDRKVKDRVIELLRKAGHTVYDCTDDTGATASANLQNIVKKCNSHEVDLDISIHFNASAGGKGHGTEAYVFSKSAKNKPATDAAQRIVDRIAKLGFTNRGVKVGSSLYVIRNTYALAILVECCFCDNKMDAARYNPDKMANAIACGILDVDSIVKKKIVKIKQDCKIRKENTKTSEVVGTALAGADYEVLEETPNWYKIGEGKYVAKRWCNG